MELTGNHIDLSREQQIRILTKLTDAEIFEQFLHTKYTGAKRFSLEGGESVIPMLDILTERASELGVEEMVIGMAHRGRLTRRRTSDAAT
jgi:2-oxoglutarate dehydrogenase E1 component